MLLYNNNNNMTEQNEITIEEAFKKFEPEFSQVPYFNIEVHIFDDKLQCETDDNFDNEFPNYIEHCYYNEYGECELAQEEILDQLNTTIKHLFNNGFVYEIVYPVMLEIQNDFKKKTEAYEDYETIDCFKLLIKIVNYDQYLNCSDVYCHYIDIFENDKDIITLPVKNAKKTK